MDAAPLCGARTAVCSIACRMAQRRLSAVALAGFGARVLLQGLV
ncbi:MAG: hypothetical protein ACYCSR_12045 [Thiomonas sp.]